MAAAVLRHLSAGFLLLSGAGFAQGPLPGTAPLTLEGDLSVQMVAGIARFLEAETTRVAGQSASRWRPDFSGDAAAYEQSVEPNRARLAIMLGLIDPRVPQPEVELSATPAAPARVAETSAFTADAVRWTVLEGLEAEGLLLLPKGPARARVVALPEADQTPEQIAGLAPGLPPVRQFARRLAEHGCEVLVPVLVDRSDAFSGHGAIRQFTNHPHREWIYRQAFVLGRHVIGYEVQKVLAAVDWFTRRNAGGRAAIGVAGWGEGGLIAFHSAAADRRIDAVLVSGYFGPRERLWEEPVYRNLFGVLTEFRDADVARLIVPRRLVIEHAPVPAVSGPPAERPGRAGAAPGRLVTPVAAAVRAEAERARGHAGRFGGAITLYPETGDAPAGPMSDPALGAFLRALAPDAAQLLPPAEAPRDRRAGFDPVVRQERQVRDMERFTQRQLALAERERDAFLWSKVKPADPAAWHRAMEPYRAQVWHERIGRFAPGALPLNPRARLLREGPTWTAYEVVLDVLPEVYAWGYFLVPKGIRPGERRPVVVTQHGVGGLPESVVTEDPESRGYPVYKAYAVRLAERGFITFAPHHPYRGDHPSRALQRRAQPIGRTIFSVMLAQHERILDWLATQPEVDPKRIAFYGLSYGGQSAMRIPILLERYALSICSGDFNEWTWKNASVPFPKSYLYNNAYERPEFRMGLTFGYAEMVALLAPRPFMVERGHNDGVGIDEWVAYEYAKVNRLYAKLGISDRTAIEYFDGPHTIHGEGTFRFLQRHLQWPEPAR